MFTQQLPPEIFQVQREFIRVTGGKLDFEWAAKTLVTEETKELYEAYNAPPSDENFKHIFKELADVIYVVAHFYNTMPVFAPELIDEDRNQEIQEILDNAAMMVSEVVNELKIPFNLVIAAFEVVHTSNMTKVNPHIGRVDRRDDGKILKGPNYVAPDMTPIVEEWKTFVREQENAE